MKKANVRASVEAAITYRKKKLEGSSEQEPTDELAHYISSDLPYGFETLVSFTRFDCTYARNRTQTGTAVHLPTTLAEFFREYKFKNPFERSSTTVDRQVQCSLLADIIKVCSSITAVLEHLYLLSPYPKFQVIALIPSKEYIADVAIRILSRFPAEELQSTFELLKKSQILIKDRQTSVNYDVRGLKPGFKYVHF